MFYDHPVIVTSEVYVQQSFLDRGNLNSGYTACVGRIEVEKMFT